MALLKDTTRIYGTCSANAGFSVDSGGTTYITMTALNGLNPASNTVGVNLGSTTQRWNLTANNIVNSGTITSTGAISGPITATTGSFSSTLSATSTITLSGATTTTTTLGTSATTGTTTIGGTTQTGAITVGQSTSAQIVNIHTGATLTATTKTLNLATAGASGSTTNINMGSATAGATGTLRVNSNTASFAGNVSANGATSTIGFATGAGGAVTQLTSRTTGVTLNKSCGAITLVSAAGSASWQSFTVTNSIVDTGDVIIVNQESGTDLYQIFVTNVGAGSFVITFATTGGTTTESPIFNFAVIKGVAA